MVGRLLRGAVALVALLDLGARVARFRAPEAPPSPRRGINYTQLRHLVAATLVIILLVVGGIWFASRTWNVLTLLAVAIILAVALRPTVDRIQHARLPILGWTTPRPLAIILIYLLLAAAAAGIGFLVTPPIVTEAQNLIAGLPGYLQSLQETLKGLQQRYPFIPELAALQSQLFSQLLGNLSQAFNALLLAVSLANSILSIAVVFVFTFFLIMDAEQIHQHFISLLPPSQQERAQNMSARMGRRIEGWLKGTILLAIILGVVTTGAMWGLDMPFPFLLGLAAGIFELVPILGPYLGAAPAVAVALFSQPLWKLIAVLLYFVLVQQVENNILAPHIMGRQVELPPLLVILALLLGAAMMGILGALLAVPVAAVVHVLWTDLIVPEIKQRQRD